MFSPDLVKKPMVGRHSKKNHYKTIITDKLYIFVFDN